MNEVMNLAPYIVTFLAGLYFQNVWKKRGSEKYVQFWKGYTLAGIVLTFITFFMFVLPSLL